MCSICGELAVCLFWLLAGILQDLTVRLSCIRLLVCAALQPIWNSAQSRICTPGSCSLASMNCSICQIIDLEK